MAGIAHFKKISVPMTKDSHLRGVCRSVESTFSEENNEEITKNLIPAEKLDPGHNWHLHVTHQ